MILIGNLTLVSHVKFMEIMKLISKSQITIKNPAGAFWKEFGNNIEIFRLSLYGWWAQIYSRFEIFTTLSLSCVLIRFMAQMFKILKKLHNDKTLVFWGCVIIWLRWWNCVVFIRRNTKFKISKTWKQLEVLQWKLHFT